MYHYYNKSVSKGCWIVWFPLREHELDYVETNEGPTV